MSTEANKAALRRYIEHVWNGGNLDAVPEFVAPDYVRHDPGLPMQVRGTQAMAHVIGLYRAALPDLHLTPLIVMAEGDLVALHVQVHGTHQGDLMGIPPTGKPIAITATEIFRFADGKIAEQWTNVDNLGMLRQVGAVPA
jgi:steroid delta-isomerase-like uncharacterized protein